MKFRPIIKPIVLLSISFIFYVSREYPKIFRYYDDFMYIYFLNVGQGDSALVKTSDRKLILIDTGIGRSVIHNMSEVLPSFVNTIDTIIISHSHLDHVGGLGEVVRKYSAKCILRCDYVLEDSFCDTRLKHGCIGENVSLKNHYNFDNNSKNLSSLITLLSYKNFDVLFTGDAEIKWQKKVLPDLDKDIEVIKVPHHGARDSVYIPLLDKIKPKIGVISVGKGNKYNHPSQYTLDVYNKMKIDLYRTDILGIIFVKTDGFNWNLGLIDK